MNTDEILILLMIASTELNVFVSGFYTIKKVEQQTTITTLDIRLFGDFTE